MIVKSNIALEAQKSFKRTYTFGLVIGLFVIGLVYLEVNPIDILIQFPDFLRFSIC